MGEYISATEAARRYHVSEKTVRTWLKTKKLPAQKIKVDGLDQWQIDTEDIEQVIAKKQTRVDTTGIVLVDMQRQIDELRAEVNALKQSIKPPAQPPSGQPPIPDQSVSPVRAAMIALKNAPKGKKGSTQ